MSITNYTNLKLHQLLAIVESVKSKAKKTESEIYKTVQKASLFDGLKKTYRPNAEEGYVYPSEIKKVQSTVAEEVSKFSLILVELFDTLATQDKSNQLASSNIVVDGVALVENVPVSHLLFLEKQLQNVVTFFNSLPVLDGSEVWSVDPNTGHYVSDLRKTNKTKKITDWKVIEGTLTDKHPAQVKEYSQDINEGVWEQLSYSGAIFQTTKTALIGRAERLLEAVVVAREEANSIEVVTFKTGKVLTSYLTEPLR